MWSVIWPVATTRISSWTWIWPTRHCGLGAGSGLLISMLVNAWRNSTSFVWPVQKHWCYWFENEWLFLKVKKMLGLIFSSKLDWGSYIISIAETASKKMEPWFVLWSFFLLRLLCISINLLYRHVWNTVVMSGLVLLVGTWNCWISYKNGSFTCCLYWTPGSTLKCSQFKSFL